MTTATADDLLRVGLPDRPHRHRPMVLRVNPEGYRWTCIDCPTTGGPPKNTSAEAWRDGNWGRW